ncbi:MAG: DUF4293 domain-containing protein [Bacteroidota bacterium]|nr:DUF4293 domain-containing protein [Bacteroidota bacterium]
MIQRIQSLYLALVVVTSGVTSLLFPIFKGVEASQDVYAAHKPEYLLLFGASLFLALISIFSYKKRQNQFVLNRLNMILNLILLGLFVYRMLNLSGEESSSEKGIGLFLPIVSVVCLVLANRAIKKDEELVKSVDRLR